MQIMNSNELGLVLIIVMTIAIDKTTCSVGSSRETHQRRFQHRPHPDQFFTSDQLWVQNLSAAEVKDI